MRCDQLNVSKKIVYEFQLPDSLVERLKVLGFISDTGSFFSLCSTAKEMVEPGKEGTLTRFQATYYDEGNGNNAEFIAQRVALICRDAHALLGRYLFGGYQGLSIDEERRCAEFLKKFPIGGDQ